MHFDWSMTCLTFLSPVIAPTAQALPQTVQPLHRSLMVYVSSFWQWCAGHFLFVMWASYS